MWQSGFAKNGKIVTIGHVSTRARPGIRRQVARGFNEPREGWLTALVYKFQNRLGELSCSLPIPKGLIQCNELLSRALLHEDPLRVGQLGPRFWGPSAGATLQG